MKIIFLYRICILSAAVLLSCKPHSLRNETSGTDSEHTSQNSLDWDGAYRGVLPCDDCEGIQTTVMLGKNADYKIKAKHLRKPDSVFEYSGKFSWSKEGNTIALNGSGNNPPILFFVGENTLTQLDKNGNKITGESPDNYILTKENYAILEKYWKLTELNGKPLKPDSTLRKEPHIIFKENDNKIVGHGGCNSIFGTEELKAGNRISLSRLGSTYMACERMEVESQFLKVLQTTDNYNLVGDMLVLNKGRMAPLAKFKTVYMK
jgi:copper homeostasis protein (lipoprotein)